MEDDPEDVWIMRNLLSDRWDGPFELVHVELLSAGVERCAEAPFDIILLDLSLPDSRGLETFFVMHANANDVPIVVLSGYDDETTAVKAVQAGAQDYLGQGEGGRQPLGAIDSLCDRAEPAAAGGASPARRFRGVPRRPGNPAAALSAALSLAARL